MKIYLLLGFASILFACKTNSEIVKDVEVSTDFKKATNDVVFCPEDGECSLEILEDSSLILKEDSIGKLYPEITKGDKTVFVYTYKRNTSGKYEDEAYVETIHFELEVVSDNTVLKDATLENVNAIYGKQCFCRGEAGFYKIEKGVLRVESLKNKVFQFDFSISNTNHVLKHIEN